jgi:uncharacterized protein
MEEKLNNLYKRTEKLYQENKDKLLFHGWHHIKFTLTKATGFAEAIKANVFIVKSAALVHDLNFILESNSEPEIAKDFRKEILSEIGYSLEEIEKIEGVIMESHTKTRNKNISNEGKALSDADTLFKSLPITPILFASKYITQNKVDIYKLSKKITEEQNPLMKENIYFYTDAAKEKYLKWAKDNLQLWNNVEEALGDEDIKEMLGIAKKNKIL